VRGSELKGPCDAADRIQVQNKASIAQNAAFFAHVNALGATLTPSISLSKLVLVMSTGQLPARASRALLEPPFSAIFAIKAAAAPPPKGKAAKAAEAAARGGAAAAAAAAAAAP